MPLPEFRALLEARLNATDAAERARIEAAIRDRWERPAAVLIADMAGFSRITRAEGILHFLGLICRMQGLCRPIVATHGGHLVKTVADNLYATFDTPDAAVRAAVAMQEACRRASTGRGANDTIALGIGVACGRILDLGGVDLYGDPVNVASKLGEDLAEGGEVLVTREAMRGLAPPPGWRPTSRVVTISGVEIDLVVLREVAS